MKEENENGEGKGNREAEQEGKLSRLEKKEKPEMFVCHFNFLSTSFCFFTTPGPWMKKRFGIQ